MGDLHLLDEVALWKYSHCTYEAFIGFVKEVLSPHMNMPFVEEPYYREVWDAVWENRYTEVMLPRGHSKSEYLGVWLTIYIVVYQPVNPFSKRPIMQQLITSSDSATSIELFDRVKAYFKDCDMITHLLPQTKGWARKIKYNNSKVVFSNNSVVYCRSIKLKRGLHVDRIIGDDLTTEASTLGDRETWGFFTGALLPMGTAKTAMVQISGTPIRHTDINMRILQGDAGDHWKCICMPAILDWEKKTLLSPQRFSWEALMQIKKTIGSVKFESEYMLNPIDSETSLIKRKWIEECCDEKHDITHHRSYFEEVYLGVDFAFSDRATADYSVFFTIGVSRGEYYMLDYVRKKGLSATDHLQFIRELNAIYKYDLIGLEENSITAVAKDWKNQGLPLKLFRTGTIDERDKRKPDFTDVISVKKENLVIRLGTTFENKQLTLPFKSEEAKEKVARLVAECVSWQLDEGKLVEVGVHPDIPIALGYALEAALKASFAFSFA